MDSPVRPRDEPLERLAHVIPSHKEQSRKISEAKRLAENAGHHALHGLIVRLEQAHSDGDAHVQRRLHGEIQALFGMYSHDIDHGTPMQPPDQSLGRLVQRRLPMDSNTGEAGGSGLAQNQPAARSEVQQRPSQNDQSNPGAATPGEGRMPEGERDTWPPRRPAQAQHNNAAGGHSSRDPERLLEVIREEVQTPGRTPAFVIQRLQELITPSENRSGDVRQADLDGGIADPGITVPIVITDEQEEEPPRHAKEPIKKVIERILRYTKMFDAEKALMKIRSHAWSDQAVWPTVSLSSTGSSRTHNAVAEILKGDTSRNNRGVHRNQPRVCFATGIEQLALKMYAPLWHEGFTASCGQGLVDACRYARNAVSSAMLEPRMPKDRFQEISSFLKGGTASKVLNQSFEPVLDTATILRAGEVHAETMMLQIQKTIKAYQGVNDLELGVRCIQHLFGVEFKENDELQKLEEMFDVVHTFLVKVAEDFGEPLNVLGFWLFHAPNTAAVDKCDLWTTWPDAAISSELSASLRTDMASLISKAINTVKNAYRHELEKRLKETTVPGYISYSPIFGLFKQIASNNMRMNILKESTFIPQSRQQISRVTMTEQQMVVQLRELAKRFAQLGIPPADCLTTF